MNLTAKEIDELYNDVIGKSAEIYAVKGEANFRVMFAEAIIKLYESKKASKE